MVAYISSCGVDRVVVGIYIKERWCRGVAGRVVGMVACLGWRALGVGGVVGRGCIGRNEGVAGGMVGGGGGRRSLRMDGVWGRWVVVLCVSSGTAVDMV